MEKKRLFTKVALIATTIPLTIIPCITSCTIRWQKDKKVVKKVELTMPTLPERIKEGESAVSSPINVKCYDQDGKVIKASTQFKFTKDNGEPVPNWIFINKVDNTIHITGDALPDTYHFKLSAIYQNGKEETQSEVKSFAIEIFEEPVIGPDEIEILCDETEPTVMTTSSADLVFDVKATKDDYPSDIVSKSCDWVISNLSGIKTKDLDENPLFMLSYDANGCKLSMSTNVDETYVGDYQITILATSVFEPFASDTIDLTIHVIDGLNYYDETNKYTYARSNINETWTLTKVDSKCVSLTKALDNVYGIAVTKIANNFASNSGISRLAGISLPESYKVIGDHAFANQTILNGLAMPGVECVGEGAFENCSQVSFLKNFAQPQLQIVKARAFYGCKMLMLESENSFSEIYDESFLGTGITSINLGGCVWRIGNNCFDQCESLKTIHIDVTNPPRLEGVLFSSKTPLEHIEVPSSAVETYKNDKFWSFYKDLIVGF